MCSVCFKDLKDYMRQAGEVTYADAHKRHRNEGWGYLWLTLFHFAVHMSAYIVQRWDFFNDWQISAVSKAPEAIFEIFVNLLRKFGGICYMWKVFRVKFCKQSSVFNLAVEWFSFKLPTSVSLVLTGNNSMHYDCGLPREWNKGNNADVFGKCAIYELFFSGYFSPIV